MFCKSVGLIALTWSLSGCVTIQTVTIDEKTALERQLIGEREVWNDKAALEMSKRDAEEIIAPGFAKLLDARDAQRFLQDEWFVLMARQCASFNDETVLTIDCQEDQQARLLWEKEQVLRSEIFNWLYENRSYFAGLDKSEARKVFDEVMDQKLANAYAVFKEAAQPK